jgi:hypothetical protein
MLTADPTITRTSVISWTVRVPTMKLRLAPQRCIHAAEPTMLLGFGATDGMHTISVIVIQVTNTMTRNAMAAFASLGMVES